MKNTTNLLLAAIMIAFGCSSANAQFSYTNSLSGGTLIYSNYFDPNAAAVTVHGTALTVANSLLGGTNIAVWNCVSNGPSSRLYQNGTIDTLLNSYLLPFKPQSNYVYTLTAVVTVPVMTAGKYISMGFSQFDPSNAVASRFGDAAITGNPWAYLTEGSGGVVFFPVRATSSGSPGQLLPTAGTYTAQLVLDATSGASTNWISSVFVNGTQVSTNYHYGTTAVTISAVGLGQTTLNSSSGIRWNSLTLSGTPLVIGQQPVSAVIGAGTAFTNSVAVVGRGPLSYQWYTNDVPLTNGIGGVNGATTNVLIINPVSTASAYTNCYVIVTNSFGSVTSAVVSLTVVTNPVILAAYPVAYTNPISLFGGVNVGGTNYPGSSPDFSISVLGGVPITYQWLTNGVTVGGATGASFTFTNCQLSSPTNFVCVVSNSYGLATNAWSVSYVQAPLTPYPAALLATQPLGYWRLNEAEVDNNGDDGVLALDYGSGNDGIYTNVYLGNSGYSSISDPNETSVEFGPGPDSDAFAIQGINFATPANTSATFSVEAWVDNGIAVEPANAGIVAKGYGGVEEFALFVSGGYRFDVRDAAGNVYTASSSITPNGNWQHLVGVCDEVNSNVTLYVNGVPSASVAIAPAAGLLSTGASVPMTIGARSSSPTVGHNDLQYKGFMNDVSVHNYALSASQVANLYAAAGNSIPVSFVLLPPTNLVYQANRTLTIPATAFGAPPIGYYWTNVTAGGVLGSGTTNAFANLNATLTIPNASAGLSGDQLELVVTNGISSTNSFLTLFSPPPPVTLDYSNPILYSNYFNGGTWSIAGMPLTAANSLVGGTNTTWLDVLGTNDTGSMQANGVDTCTLGDSWILPFTPEAGYVYTVTASLTFSAYPGNWVGLGFAQRYLTDTTTARFDDNGPNGYDWIIMSDNTANVQYFAGAEGNGPVTNQNTFFSNTANTPHTVQVVLDTTQPQWVQSASVDGVSAGTNTYASNPPISAVGITQNALSAPTDVLWNYWSMTQYAPGGVPPYLLAPLPSTNSILLTNGTVAISVTAFGSAPLGYYWMNNSTVIASGLTNNMAPLPASLSIFSTSLSPGQLELVVTNAYGTNLTLITLVSAVNPNPGPIQYSVANNQLTLSWPTNLGWTLQAQTNSLEVGLSTNWVNVPASTLTNQIVVPINPPNSSAFYRLLSPF